MRIEISERQAQAVCFLKHRPPLQVRASVRTQNPWNLKGNRTARRIAMHSRGSGQLFAEGFGTASAGWPGGPTGSLAAGNLKAFKTEPSPDRQPD